MLLSFIDLKSLLVFNIKYYRYANNLSQESLAEMCGFSSRYLTDIERGKHCPTINKIDIIAKSLKIEPYKLLQNPKRDKKIIERMENSRQYNQK